MTPCERRKYHRVKKAGEAAACLDCIASGSLDWGREEMRKEGVALLFLGGAIEDLGSSQMRSETPRPTELILEAL